MSLPLLRLQPPRRHADRDGDQHDADHVVRHQRPEEAGGDVLQELMCGVRLDVTRGIGVVGDRG